MLFMPSSWHNPVHLMKGKRLVYFEEPVLALQLGFKLCIACCNCRGHWRPQFMVQHLSLLQRMHVLSWLLRTLRTKCSGRVYFACWGVFFLHWKLWGTVIWMCLQWIRYTILWNEWMLHLRSHCPCWMMRGCLAILILALLLAVTKNWMKFLVRADITVRGMFLYHQYFAFNSMILIFCYQWQWLRSRGN